MLTELMKAELDLFLTPHDLNRLEKYAQNMVDYHLVMDLLPTLARLYFTRRLDVHLNELKSVSLPFTSCEDVYLHCFSTIASVSETASNADSLTCKGISRETFGESSRLKN